MSKMTWTQIRKDRTATWNMGGGGPPPKPLVMFSAQNIQLAVLIRGSKRILLYKREFYSQLNDS